jgi:hypothetical protein
MTIMIPSSVLKKLNVSNEVLFGVTQTQDDDIIQ